jgi:polysaccharide biosynthesis/export protein
MGQIRYLVLVCLLLFWAPLLARPQGGLVARPPAAGEYVLGPGDQIAFHVIDMEDEIPDKPVRVDSNGFVDIPLAGRFRVGGLTLEQFKAELASRISKYINNPRISASLTEEKGRSVSISGSVANPGVHQLPGPERLIEVLSLAGGTRSDAGWQVIVTREQKWGKIPLPNAIVDPTTGSSTASLALDDLQSSTNPSDNIPVMPNDIIFVPKAEVVYVLGNVRKSGGFQLSSHSSISVLQAITLAESYDKDAALTKAMIIRRAAGGDGKTTQLPVNIAKILAGKDSDVALKANDILFLPSSGVKSGTLRAVGAIIQAAAGAAVYRF